MKKTGLLIASLAFSVTCFAGQLNTSDQIKTTDCPDLLNENAQLNLTSGVVAGFSCDAKGISLSTCNSGGRTSKREVEVLCPDPNDATKEVSCNPKKYETKQGGQYPYATTARGTVQSDYPNTTCTAANAESVATAKKVQ